MNPVPARLPKFILEQKNREPIAITEVRVTPITYKPADGAYIHECGPVVLTKRDAAVVQVFTDQGIVGIGPGEPADASKDYSFLIGRNPFDVPLMNVDSGIDVACWDIIGRAKGQPVYKILAGDHEPDPRVHVYASGGVMWTYYDRGDGQPYGVDALIEEALRYQALGFDTFKWRPGTDWAAADMNPTKLGEICRQLREAVGPDFDLGLEKKGYDTWSFDECMEMAPILNDLGFLFFEQPMGDGGPDQFDAYRAIKARMPNVMLWGGEQLLSLAEVEPWMSENIYDAIQTDCERIGLTEEWRIAQLAVQTNTKIVPHNWTSSLGTMCNTHLVAATEKGSMCEFFMYPNGFRDGLFTAPYMPENGYITLADSPGFGMDLVDDFAERFPYEPGSNVLPNPRFPRVWDRVRTRLHIYPTGESISPPKNFELPVGGDPVDALPTGLIDQFSDVSTATACAALSRLGITQTFMRGPTSRQPGRKVAGRAITLQFMPLREDIANTDYYGEQSSALWAVFDTIQPGDLLIIQAEGDPYTGVIGEMLAAYCKGRGGIGVFVDGYVRDWPGISPMDIPVWSYGSTPHFASQGKLYPWAYNVPVNICGVLVLPGDLVIADDDGGVVVPRQMAETVGQIAKRKELWESFSRERLLAGGDIKRYYPLSIEAIPEFEAWLQERGLPDNGVRQEIERLHRK